MSRKGLALQPSGTSRSTSTQTGRLLRSYLASRSQAESSDLLERLISDFAQPIIRDIVSFKLRVWPWGVSSGYDKQDAEDLCGEVTLRLMNRLSGLKRDPAKAPIANLRSYLAVMSYNACDEYLRRKYPERHRLKNKIRYLLSRQSGFALWVTHDQRWLAGYSDWRNTDWSGHRTWEAVDTRGESLDPGMAGPGQSSRTGLGVLVGELLTRTARPVELDALVDAIASICGIKDQPAQLAQRREDADAFLDPRIGAHETVDNRILLARLWWEIRELPLKQRTALLLNLRDSPGESILELLPRIGLASIREIADALEMDSNGIVALWNQLPLEDSVIAERLGVTRQQVINLRKSARERLLRRIGSGARDKANLARRCRRARSIPPI